MVAQLGLAVYPLQIQLGVGKNAYYQSQERKGPAGRRNGGAGGPVPATASWRAGPWGRGQPAAPNVRWGPGAARGSVGLMRICFSVSLIADEAYF